MVFDPERRQAFGGRGFKPPPAMLEPKQAQTVVGAESRQCYRGQGKTNKGRAKTLADIIYIFFFPFYFYLPGLEPKVLASPREMKQFSTNNIYVQGL